MTEWKTIDSAPKDGSNWLEDTEQYLNQCCQCGEFFYGYKRRVVCRACTLPAPPEDVT